MDVDILAIAAVPAVPPPVPAREAAPTGQVLDLVADVMARMRAQEERSSR
jgi:hypothetical protein